MRQLFIIFGILYTFSSCAQQIVYPYNYIEQNTMFKEVLFLEEEIVFVQYDAEESMMSIDHFSYENLEIMSSDYLDLAALFSDNIEGISAPLFVQKDFGYEVYGFASSFIQGEFQMAFRIQINDLFEVIQFDNSATDLENSGTAMGNWGQKVYIDDEGIYYFHSSKNPLSYTFRMSSDWEFLNSAEHIFYPYNWDTGFGRTFHGFGNEVIICDRDSCITLDSSLIIQEVSYFNHLYYEWEPTEYTFKSYFSGSSLKLEDSSFLIQALAYDYGEDEWPFPDYKLQNLIWKISSSGEILDSALIRKPETDFYHQDGMLSRDGNRIYGASIMKHGDPDVYTPQEDSLFFYSINEDLDSLWSTSFGSNDYKYLLEGIEAKNNCLIAYGKEIPVNGEPWEMEGRFFLLKFSEDDLGLSVQNLAKENKLLNIYPNPASNNIFVEASSESNAIESIIVYDLIGNLVYLKDLENKDKLYEEIDISLWARGMYILKTLGKGSSFSSKIIKE